MSRLLRTVKVREGKSFRNVVGLSSIFSVVLNACVRFNTSSDMTRRTFVYHLGEWRMTRLQATTTDFSDEDGRWSRWAGGDLGPLAHESALTVFWRFCWRNVMDPVRTRESFSDQGVRIEWKQFQKVTGWRAPQAIELRIHGLGQHLRDFLFEERLRVCPVCLECAYHSVWHQLRVLRVCPLHNIPLKTECQYCGGTTESISKYFTRSMSARLLIPRRVDL